jgi:hypothetical protein
MLFIIDYCIINGTLLRFLTTLTTSVENLPDMGRMIPYTETILDYLGYPWQCPQLIFIPLSQRPFHK